jgi:hypothetical protein
LEGKNMKKESNYIWLWVLSLVACLVVGAAFGGFALSTHKVEFVDKEVVVMNNTVEYVDVVEEVEVIKEVEVLVDNEKLNEFVEYCYESNCETLFDGLDDDEYMEGVDRMVFEKAAKQLAADSVDLELFDELDNEDLVMADNSTFEFDEDDMERLRVDDDLDELIVDDIDYDDFDADIKVTGSFEQDDEEFDFEALVRIKDGEFDKLKDIIVLEA